jgi:hypothetical protein
LTNRAAWEACCHRPSAHPVSTKARVAVHSCMTTCIGPPQVGQQATNGAGGGGRRALEIAGGCLQDHQAEGVGRDGTACVQQAAGADLHKALGPAMLEDAAEQLDGVERGRAEAGTAGCTGGAGDGTVREAHDAAVGNSHFEDLWGKIVQGGGGMWRRLAVDVPGDGPDLWGDGLQPSGCAHLLFPQGAGDGGEGLHGDKAVRSGGPPRCTVL